MGAGTWKRWSAIGVTCMGLLVLPSVPATGAGDEAFTYYVGKGQRGDARLKVGLRIRSSDLKIKDTYIDFNKIECDGGGKAGGFVGVSNDGKVGDDGRFKSKTHESDLVFVDGRIQGTKVHGRARVQVEEDPINGTPACDSGKVSWDGAEVSKKRFENQIFG